MCRYLAIRPAGNKLTYRAFCGRDSDSQRARDAQAAAQRLADHQRDQLLARVDGGADVAAELAAAGLPMPT